MQPTCRISNRQYVQHGPSRTLVVCSQSLIVTDELGLQIQTRTKEAFQKRLHDFAFLFRSLIPVRQKDVLRRPGPLETCTRLKKNKKNGIHFSGPSIFGQCMAFVHCNDILKCSGQKRNKERTAACYFNIFYIAN